ncbi:hypothetical protein [Devosia aquimaris]|uniref:hypothetical protein n=1 Tax=Devosia aquimaris TaxID=2866214 RepID=UPI001CD0D84A|nr:hypothetical protein [Devosia sp. CJK-A8-3]
MSQADLEADCSRCAGLCCVALAFDRSDRFGHDKLAGEPCYHLASDFRCKIHARREELGYDGCVAFDCLGAGQRATAMFAQRDWRGDRTVALALYARFSLMTKLQEMRQALMTAADLELAPEHEAVRVALLSRIVALADHVPATPEEDDIDPQGAAVLAEAKQFLRRLADVVSF